MFAVATFYLTAWGTASVAANLVLRQTQAPTTTAATPKPTAITSCHLHASDLLVLLIPETPEGRSRFLC